MNPTRRNVATGFATALASTAVAPLFGQAAAAPLFDVLPFVHPDLRPLVAPIVKATGGMRIDAATLAETRARSGMFTKPPLAAPAWSERTVPGGRGDPAVRVYIVNAGQKAQPRPAILHVHGGGYIFGTAKDYLYNLQNIANEIDCVIVSVDYRLAPETKFPGPLEDCYAGLEWLHANAASLGADPARIAVMGESAGGGLAAMLAIAARDRGQVPLTYQCLIYPMLDDRTGSTVRKPPQQGAIIWTPESNRFGWSSLLGVPAGSRTVPRGAVPARESNLAGLPPTFISVGSIDLFVDEDVEYARRLLDAGVPTELVVMPGGFHGFDMFDTAPVVKRYRQHMIAALRQGLGA